MPCRSFVHGFSRIGPHDVAMALKPISTCNFGERTDKIGRTDRNRLRSKFEIFPLKSSYTISNIVICDKCMSNVRQAKNAKSKNIRIQVILQLAINVYRASIYICIINISNFTFTFLINLLQL